MKTHPPVSTAPRCPRDRAVSLGAARLKAPRSPAAWTWGTATTSTASTPASTGPLTPTPEPDAACAELVATGKTASDVSYRVDVGTGTTRRSLFVI